MRAIDGFDGHAVTRAALRLAPHVFVRPGELRHAEWLEIDFDKALWSIPAEKMKMRRPHRVPLSRQSLAVLSSIRASTLLNEMGKWHPDAIERQLAHAEADAVRRAYARGEYWDERVAMMQAWSDYLDGAARS